ncbi:hypothetical protein NP493_393g04002 [Ridgeia piscesae]|uniref:Uncharacterized protein n=1 Tax=Ridgeia piscesae TaxID=27915 RepID=A0AAD9L1Y5_RIDPI|nr:hypothetical protein NP493_393g04002 [Ridgeia piscesae]
MHVVSHLPILHCRCQMVPFQYYSISLHRRAGLPLDRFLRKVSIRFICNIRYMLCFSQKLHIHLLSSQHTHLL